MKTVPSATPGAASGAAPASIPISPSQKWKWSANVLLIGTSQSGKSTLINRFRTLAVGPQPLPDPAQVGRGTTSCTRDPVMYEYDIPTTDFILLDSQNNTKVDVPADEDDIFGLGFWNRKDLVMRRRNLHADLARIRLIDTPGLDDSDRQKNVTNIEKVLRLLNTLSSSQDLDQRHINAVVFVIQGTVAFNASLQNWYYYYRRCMPNLFGSVIVVNTNMRVRDWKTEYARKAGDLFSLGNLKLNSRENKMRERRKAWAEIFKNDPMHFFIDSKPTGAYDGYMSANTVYVILLYLRNQGRLPIENIRLSKFGSMLSIDNKLAENLHQVCETWDREKEHLALSLSTTHKSLCQHRKAKVIWETEIEELESRLREIDTDARYDLNTFQPPLDITLLSKISAFFTCSGHEGTHPITEDVFPYEVTAPDTENVRWKSRSMVNPSTKTWKGEWVSKWTRMPDYSIRTYTTNKTFYAKEISSARNQVYEREERRINTVEIIASEETLVSGSSGLAQDNPRIVQLDKWIARGGKHMRHLRAEDVPLHEGFSPSAVRRYAKTSDEIGYSDVLDFVADAEPELRSAVEVAIAQLTGMDGPNCRS